jgi:TrmH family RNA methyltransferase
VVSQRLVHVLSATESPQGILAVVAIPSPAPGPAQPPLWVIADGISDPGNLGTLLRSAAAAGVTAVHTTEGTADPFNPKVVRAAMGAHFRVPILPLSWSMIEQETFGTHIVGARPGARIAYTDVDLTRPTAIVVGSEAQGITNATSSSIDTFVSIPMASETESLNVSTAASIILFEALRQRSVDHRQP